MTHRSAEVDAAIAALPAAATAERMEAVRSALHEAIPSGFETVRYGMPALMLGTGRSAVHFAAWKAHIGLYPVPDLGPGLEEEVAPLRRGEDAVALRHRDPLPVDLVGRVGARIVELRGA